MNRKHLSLLAMILALVLACAPLSAMAESYSSTAFTLKNPSITIGDQTITAEVSLSLDYGVDSENGVGRLLLSLMGGDETALSGGASWDGESIIAGLDGMSKCFSFPVTELVDQVQVGGNDLSSLEQPYNDLIAALAAFETYSPSKETVAQMISLASDAFGLTYTEDTTFTYDEDTTLEGICYDFSTSYSKIAKLIEDCRALDPDLDALFKDVESAFNALVAAANADVEFTADETLAIEGYVLITDNGDFVVSFELKDAEDEDDDDDDDTAVCEIVALNKEDSTDINVYAEVYDDDDEKQYISIDVVMPNGDGDVVFSFYTDNIENYETDIGESFQIVLLTDSAISYVTAAVYTTEYSYSGDERCENANSYALTYVPGEAESGDDYDIYPGTLVFNCTENNETVVTATLETELRAYTSDQGYTPSGDVIDLSGGELDDDTQEELYSELMTVVGNAIAVLSSANGVSDLLSLFGLN